MFIVPRDPVAAYGGYVGQDFGFIYDTLQLRGDEPVHHDDIVATIRPPTLRSALKATVSLKTQKRVFTRTMRRVREHMASVFGS